MHGDRTIAEVFFQTHLQRLFWYAFKKRPQRRFSIYVTIFLVNSSFCKPHYADNVVFIFEKISLFTTMSTLSRTSSSVVFT